MSERDDAAAEAANDLGRHCAHLVGEILSQHFESAGYAVIMWPVGHCEPGAIGVFTCQPHDQEVMAAMSIASAGFRAKMS